MVGSLEFLYKNDLPHRVVAVYRYLFDPADRQGQCWPAITTVARDLKRSECTVRRALDDLQCAGLITTAQRTIKNGGKAVCFIRSSMVGCNCRERFARDCYVHGRVDHANAQNG